MKQITILIVFLFLGIVLKGQEVKELQPTIGQKFNFSPEFIEKFNSEEAFKACGEVWKKINAENRNYSQITPAEYEILKYCEETKQDVWDIVGGGCSWYCGGGPKLVTASSYLSSQGDNNYEPSNAHDLNYKNAWVEGVAGYGIGEYLVYKFEPASPRITKIIIANGYIKSKSAWENNSRVKKLKVYFNDKPLAILNLKDVYAEQSFILEPIGNSERKDWEKLKTMPAWTLKFEILEVYKGKKYDDVAISEIYFDGLDVHCLTKGTKVSLTKNSFIEIEKLSIGDSVLYFDMQIQNYKRAKIEKLENVKHCNLVTYIFENGNKITSTKDHPFLTVENIWCSYSPDKTAQYKGFSGIMEVKIGNVFKLLGDNGEIVETKLVDIELVNEEQETYTISKLSHGDNFIANGLIVGVEELK